MEDCDLDLLLQAIEAATAMMARFGPRRARARK
jgi:hypothetical protein